MIYSVCKCDTQPSVRYLMGGKRKGLGRVCKPLLRFKAKPSPPKQSVKFKCQIWFKITKKLAKKCLDASSLHNITGHKGMHFCIAYIKKSFLTLTLAFIFKLKLYNNCNATMFL